MISHYDYIAHYPQTIKFIWVDKSLSPDNQIENEYEGISNDVRIEVKISNL